MSSVKKGDRVVVIYEKEKFIGKVMRWTRCSPVLTKSLGVNILQDFKKDDSVYYEIIYSALKITAGQWSLTILTGFVKLKSFIEWSP